MADSPKKGSGASPGSATPPVDPKVNPKKKKSKGAGSATPAEPVVPAKETPAELYWGNVVKKQTDAGKKQAQTIQDPKTIETKLDQLYSASRKALGEYLCSIFPNATADNNVLKGYLMNLGPLLLELYPNTDNNSPQAIRKICYVAEINAEFFKKNVVGSAFKTLVDKLKDADADTVIKKTKFSALSESGYVEKYMLELNCATRCTSEDTPPSIFFNPLSIVMGMKPELRPVAAVAIDDAIKNNIIVVPNRRTENRNHFKDLMRALPATYDITLVASQYGIKEDEVAQTLKNFNEVVQDYQKKWGDC